MREHRKLAAIMFTDISGYSKMMAKDEKQAMEILQKYVRKLIDGFSTTIKTKPHIREENTYSFSNYARSRLAGRVGRLFRFIRL
jgi:hypothetical protein